MTKMASRVQALEEKVIRAVPRKIHLISSGEHKTTREAVEAFKRDHPGTQDDEFIVMVPMSAVAGEEID
jgi:hypothetical protein